MNNYERQWKTSRKKTITKSIYKQKRMKTSQPVLAAVRRKVRTDRRKAVDKLSFLGLAHLILD